MESAVVYALLAYKNRKASGKDNIYTKMLRLVDTGKLPVI
jgi:hypothetical protein